MGITAKSVVFDFANNWGNSYSMGVRSIEFFLEDALVAFTVSDFTAYATHYTEFPDTSIYYYPRRAFDQTLSKTGNPYNKEWKSSYTTTERLIIVFDSETTFDEIRIHNSHDAGYFTDKGVKDTKIYISDDAITDTTYNAAISNSFKIFDGTISQHTASDVEDEEALTLTIPPTEVDISPFVCESVATVGDIVGDAYTDMEPFVSESVLSVTAVGDVVICEIESSFASNGSMDMGGYEETVAMSVLTGAGTISATARVQILMAALTGEASLDALCGELVYCTPFVSTTKINDVVVDGFNASDARLRYLLVLEGEADGYDDITLPMSSFQARRRSGESSYLSVVIPTYDYADEISNRSNGDMVIYQAYEVEGEIKQQEEILRTDIEDVRVDIGATSQSMSMSGRKQRTFSAKAVTLSHATYKAINNGSRRYRLSEPYIFLNPGDTVTIGDDTFTVGVMSYAISPMSHQLEIEEG